MQTPWLAGVWNRALPNDNTPPVAGAITPVRAVVPVQFDDIPYSNNAVVEAPKVAAKPHP